MQHVGCVQTEPKLLRNGWTDESTPSVRRLPVNPAAAMKTDGGGCRRQGGGGGGTGGPSTAGASVESPVTIAGVTLRVPDWLPAWWQEFTSDKAVMVEVISRALFPLMFFIFNAVYWPWYLM